MADTTGAKDSTVIIKKYANRRLYNTQSSSYITLDHLAKMTREGIEFRVLDAKSGAEITHQILTQIIMEEEASGEQMLPVNFLRQLIGMYGNSMQGLVPHFLEASMDQFRANQMKLRKAFEESVEANPLARLAQQNIAMFQAAAAAFMPVGEGGVAEGEKPAPSPAASPTPAAEPAADTRGELDALREQMLMMQKKLDQLGK